MEYFIVYNVASGLEAFRGQGPAGSASIQLLEEGLAAMIVPSQAWASHPLDLGTIKASYAASIDLDADKVRSMYITNTPGQMATYLVKEQEARAFLSDSSVATVFLAAEAEALGTTVLALAQEVVGQADQWRPVGAKIEALRRKAKVQVKAATNLAELAAATRIDWRTVDPGFTEEVPS